MLPESVARQLGVSAGDWVDVLVQLLESVRCELAGDVEALRDLQAHAASTQNYKLAERYKQVGRTLELRDLLGFLATRNVLPKYGFPVDSVELRTTYSGNRTGDKLDLTRDLSQAIHEYAPDATLVAGGMLWTSRGIYRLPGRELEEFEYRVCGRCGGFWHSIASLEPRCPHCGEASPHAAEVDHSRIWLRRRSESNPTGFAAPQTLLERRDLCAEGAGRGSHSEADACLGNV